MSVEEVKEMFRRFQYGKCTPEEERQILRVIKKLQREPHGNILFLHYIKGQSFQEIADETPADISSIFRWRNGLMKKASYKMRKSTENYNEKGGATLKILENCIRART